MMYDAIQCIVTNTIPRVSNVNGTTAYCSVSTFYSGIRIGYDCNDNGTGRETTTLSMLFTFYNNMYYAILGSDS